MITEQDYQAIMAEIDRMLAEPGQEASIRYGKLTDLLVRSRVRLLTKVVVGNKPPVVLSGPFAGMQFHTQSTEGCYLPKVLGCYESELHPLLQHLAQEQSYKTIIDVGCAEGYYAVGLARLFPNARVKAFDIAEAARNKCRTLSEMNGVAQRVLIGGELTPQGLTQALDGKTLVFCDCEGFEYQLLPNALPALAAADLLVELHQVGDHPQRAQALLDLFAKTHDVGVFHQSGRNPAQIPSIATWKHLDQLLAVWEFRAEPTPWLWLKAKINGAPAPAV